MSTPDSPSVPLKVTPTGALYQPPVPGSRVACEPVAVGAVASYLRGKPRSAALPALSVQRPTTDPVALDVDLRSVPGLRLVEATSLSNPDHTWTASADDDTSVRPQPNGTVAVADGRRLRLSPKARSVSVPGVAKRERVTVTVRGVDRLARSGPAAKARRGGR